MDKKQRIVLASGNAHKIREIGEMLPEFEVVGYKELGFDQEIVEDGNTFYENALIKAKTVSEALNLPALADDSGLEVECLGGAPGVYSARYAGEPCDNARNRAFLLENMKNSQNRKARFVSCIVLYNPNGQIVCAEGYVDGEILEEEQGNNGFGYDCLFYSYDLKKCFGIATDEEKNSVSHRGRALRALLEKL